VAARREEVPVQVHLTRIARSHVVYALTLISLLAACAPAAPPSPTAAPAKPAQPAPAATTAPAAAPAKAAAAADPLADLVQKASQEREIILQMPDPVRMSTADAARAMSQGLKKSFGIDVNIKIDNSLSYNASAAKAVSEVKAGSPPSYDLMYQTSVTGIPLYEVSAIEKVDWLATFKWITEKDVEYGGQALIANTQFVLPSYNTTQVKGNDVPKTWDDLLNPRWKGKLGSTIYQDPWSHLAEPNGWGEEKTLAFVKRLAEQEPVLGRFPELHQKVVAGEIALTAVDHSFRAEAAKQAGAPVDVAVVEPIIVFVNVGIVPKGARNKHAAALLNAWFLSEDGQKFMDQGHSSTSLFKPGTPAAKFVEGRKYVTPTEFQIKNTIRLQKQYEDIIVKR
jgi:iron(III) transport system substrate-binding protein